MARLQEETAAHRAAAKQASATRLVRLRLEWSVLLGSLRILGGRLTGMLGLPVLLLGIGLGLWAGSYLGHGPGGINAPAMLNTLTRVIGLSPDSGESPRLAKVPVRLRLDRDLEAFGHRVQRLPGKRD